MTEELVGGMVAASAIADTAGRSSAPPCAPCGQEFAGLLLAPGLPRGAELAELEALIGKSEPSLEGDREAATDEYSPEAWLELLAVALTGVTTRQHHKSMGQQPAQSSSEDRAAVRAAVVRAVAAADAVAPPPTDAASSNLVAAVVGSAPALPSSVRGMEVASAPALPSSVLGMNVFAAAEATPATTDSDANRAHATSHIEISPVRRARVEPMQAPLREIVGSPGWTEEVATRVVMLASAAERTATLTMTPRDLGPVEVRITLRDADASVVFNAAQPETRQALEAALPRLRELFASQGMQLTETSVSGDPARSHRQRQESAAGTPDSRASDAAPAGDARSVDAHEAQWRATRLLDTYA